MTASTLFEKQFPGAYILSREEAIKFAEDFAEVRKLEFQKAKEQFNSERWMNEELLRKKYPKKD
jgi:hypothetical protein